MVLPKTLLSCIMSILYRKAVVWQLYKFLESIFRAFFSSVLSGAKNGPTSLGLCYM